MALDTGVKETRIAQAVFRVMSTPVYGDKKCCYCNNTILEPSFIQHLSISHNFNYSRLFSTLTSNKSTLFELPLSKDILKLKSYHQRNQQLSLYIVTCIVFLYCLTLLLVCKCHALYRGQCK